MGGGTVAFAQVYPSTLCADGNDKAKMAGGGRDVQMADTAGAAGSGAYGARCPSGRAGSVASVDSGSS